MDKFKELEANIKDTDETVYVCYLASKQGIKLKT